MTIRPAPLARPWRVATAMAISLSLAGSALAQTGSPAPSPAPVPSAPPLPTPETQQLVNELTLMLKIGGAPQEQAEVDEFLMTHPDALPPWHFLKVSYDLWQRGDRQQAAFWYYFFEIRANAWGRYDRGIGDMVTDFERQFGPIVNRWIQGDDAVWRDTYARAASYERKAPMYPKPPEGISQETWDREMADWRQNAQAARDRAFALSPEELAKRRKRDKVKMGPLPQMGAPLRDDWR